MSFSEWKEYKLEDVTINYNSKRVPLSSKERELRQGKYPYYGAQGVIDFIDKFILEGQYLLVAEDGANLETRNEDIARLTKNQEQFWVNNHAHILRSNENSDIRYIKYFLNKSDLSGYITGSAQPKLNKANLNSIRMVLPPFEEQKAIAHILSTLDEKIEVNNQINKTLENMAQAIFKHWFVDFEFPNEEGEPYKSSGGEMVESELGMIPKGWEVVDIEHITLKANTGADAIRRAPIVDYVTETKCVRVGDLSQGRDISGWGYCETTEEDFVRFQLKQNDILVTRTGTIGLNILITEDLKAVFNNGLIRLRVKEEYNPIFIYQLINSKNYFDHINKITGETSTRPNMKINYLLRFKFALPTNHYMNEYSKFTKSILERITVVKYENEKLKQVRDSLLPKLMSGEIRVPLDEEGDVS